jgi:hypothetical protein
VKHLGREVDHIGVLTDDLRGILRVVDLEGRGAQVLATAGSGVHHIALRLLIEFVEPAV